MPDKILNWISNFGSNQLEKYNKYFFVALIFTLIIITIVFNYNNGGFGDFYYHAGVVNELQVAPFNPKHPFYGTNDPTQYFTPYHLLVALFGNTFNLNAVESLMVFSIINILIFISGLYVFIKNLKEEFSIICLFFILFLWSGVFGFSGEYSFRFLPKVSSYHSLFALGIMLFAYGCALNVTLSKIVICSFLASISIISQPITIFAVIFGIPILFYKKINDLIKAILYSIFFGIILLVLLWFWPYYSFYELAFSQAKNANPWIGGTFPMYSLITIIKVTLPVLILCPLLIIDGIKKHSFLLLIAFSIFVPYVFYASKNSEFTGRSLIYIILMIQISLSFAIVNLIKKNKKWVLVLIFLSPLFLYNLIFGTRSLSKGDSTFLKPMKQEMLIVNRHLKHNDIVITDLNTGYYLVGFNAKIIATIFPQYFVDDEIQRMKDIDLFYDKYTTNLIRQQILKKYNAKYILINKNKIRLKLEEMFIDANKSITDSTKLLGNTILDMDQLLLIRINGDL